jgi:uncharacterized membrane protein YeaQ/YmgE (transglycosylase-associated protein family)
MLGADGEGGLMPDLGIFGWIIVGLIAGALAGALVPGRQRFGCLGTMLVGIAGGLLGGWLWVNVLGFETASGWLGAIVVATLGALILVFLLRGLGGNRD